MTKIASPEERHRFVPEDEADKPEGERIAYVFRTPRVYDESALRWRCRHHADARPVSLAELRASLKTGIRKVYERSDAPDANAEAERALSTVEAVWASTEAHTDGDDEAAAIAEDLQDELQAIESVVRSHYPPYEDLVAMRRKYLEAQGVEAVRLFLVDVEGVDLGAIAADGATDQQLRRIPRRHWNTVQLEALRLMRPDAGEGEA